MLDLVPFLLHLFVYLLLLFLERQEELWRSKAVL